MTTDIIPRIDGAGPQAVGAAAPAAIAGGQDSASFRRLLDSLEKLAKDHQKAPPAATVADADQLQAAMQRADQGFTTAMDLRRQLEDAFRSRMS